MATRRQKDILLGFNLGLWTMGTISAYFMVKFSKDYDKLYKSAKFNIRVLESFVEHSDPVVISAVTKDTEFDWIVKDIDPPRGEM